MSSGQALNIASLANAVYEGVLAHYAQARATDTLPAIRGVFPGAPESIAWDCEQLTVTLRGVGWGTATDAPMPIPRAGSSASGTGLRHVIFVVQLVRCTPSPVIMRGKASALPDLGAMAAAGQQFMRDTGLISQALAETATNMGRALPPEVSVQAGLVDPVGPEGGFHGLEGTIAITASRLDG